MKRKSNIIIVLLLIISVSLILYNLKMENEDNIYVHLPSNIMPNSPVQVGNTIGNYITRLPYKRNFSDEWEVGLTQYHTQKVGIIL